DVYETKDGLYVSVGPIEPQFFAILREKLALDSSFGSQLDQARWPEQKEALAGMFLSKTRAEWCAIFDGTDACVAPVLSMEEAPRHPHNEARKSFVSVGGAIQPAPTPRFSRTMPEVPEPVKHVGADTKSVLRDFGFEEADIDALIQKGAVSVA
ncbi:MAG: CoA transferase, partial [Polyangiaceae bacterium]|nr:CoA transferase [Polyangiaceae bacterium]